MKTTAQLIAILLLFQVCAIAQEISLPNSEVSLELFMSEIEKQSDYAFVYSGQDIDVNQKLKIKRTSGELRLILNQVGISNKLRFEIMKQSIVVKNDRAPVLQQQIKGTIKDKSTGELLPGATILLDDSLKGTTSDIDGNFSLLTSVGRHRIIVGFVGFEPQVIPVLVNSGWPVYLEVDLLPTIEALNEVVITQREHKSSSINSAVYNSAQTFSLDETNRYAGTLGDPSRMVRSFAGVVPERDDRNDIIVRGNSPTTVLFRLEDIEIPNPNHYGGIGLTGNTTTLLNINLLDNSDFITGAFPSQYSNATGAVFDLKLRDPDPNKRKYRFQTGWNGFELGAEGPFSKKHNQHTYSLTYRYSFLDIMKYVGWDAGVLPEFQDVTAKVKLKPTEKLEVDLIGLWGISYINLDDRESDSTDIPQVYGTQIKTGSDIWLGGVNTRYQLTKRTFFKSSLSVLNNKIKTEIDTFNFENQQTAAVLRDNSSETKYSAFLESNSYVNRRNKLTVGLRYDLYDINYALKAAHDNPGLQTLVDGGGDFSLYRLYAEDEHRITEKVTVRAGVSSQFLDINSQLVIEPRAAISYKLKPRHNFSASYGLHSQLQPRTIYFVETQLANGESTFTNKNLGFTRAHHGVIGHNFLMTENMRIKTEAYYQELFDIPVKDDMNSTFSLINTGANFFIPQEDSLINEGKGRNYGVEITAERFLKNGWYYLMTASIFESKYTALDGVWRNTAFNANYILNATTGYEFWVSPNKAIGIDLKTTYAGGKLYTPVDEVSSLAEQEVVLFEKQAFSNRFSDYFRVDLKLFYRFNYQNVYTEFMVDLQNLTNQQNVYSQEFIPARNSYNTFHHMGFFPMFTFKVLF